MVPQPDIRQNSEQLFHRFTHSSAVAARYSIAGGLLAMPILCGAAVGPMVPTTVHITPEISVDAALQMGDTSQVSLGTLGTIYLPAVYRHEKVVGDVSVRLKVNEIPMLGKDSVGESSGLLTNTEASIVDPIKRAILKQVAYGAAVGLGLDAAAVGLTLYSRRRQTAQNSQTTGDAAVGEPPLSASGREAKADPADVKHRFLAVTAAASLLLTACSYKVVPVDQLIDQIVNRPRQASMPLNESLTNLVPLLKGATVSGIGGQAVNATAVNLEKRISGVDAVWQRAQVNFITEITKLRHSGNLDYGRDPAIVPILQVSDIHGNQAFEKYMFGLMVRQLDVKIVLNSGDTYTATNSLPFEANSMTNLLAAIGPDQQNGNQVIMINVKGNHDPEREPSAVINARGVDGDGVNFKQYIELDKDNHFTATVDGVSFVGAPDPMLSGLSGTVPADPRVQADLIARQGHDIAEAACKLENDTGVRPLAIGHRPESLLETIRRGCALEVSGGHTHESSDPVTVVSDSNRTVIQQILGSSGGASPDSHGDLGITIYAEPHSPAMARLKLYNTSTHLIEGYIDVIISSNGDVSVKPIDVPKTAKIVEN